VRSGSEPTVFIAHSEAGAILPFAMSASVMAKYVFEGKIPASRQCQTVFGLTPIQSATAEFPPRLSMTAPVVSKLSISPILSKEFGKAIPKRLSWQNNLEKAMLPHMAWEPDNNDDVARRLKIVRHYAGCGGWGGQTRFAALYGFEVKNWNNYERGFTIPTPEAVKLSEKLGISLDWIYRGRSDGHSFKLRTELEEAEKAMTEPEEDASRKA
jgi:hypothetical protein